MNLVLPFDSLVQLFVSFIPVGFLAGCIPMVMGLGINGMMKIFKRV